MSKYTQEYYICDICGKQYSTEEFYFKYKLRYGHNNMHILPNFRGETITKEFHLCNECGHELEKFLLAKDYFNKGRGNGQNDR